MQIFCIFSVSRDFGRELLQDFVNFLQRRDKRAPPQKRRGGMIALGFGFGDVTVGAVDGVVAGG